MGPDAENRVRGQDTGSPVSSGFASARWAGALSCKNKTPLVKFPPAFFLQNVLQLRQQRWLILHVDSLALWNIINEEDVVLIPKNRIEARTFPADFCTRNFWCRVSCYAVTPLIVALSPGYSDITRFHPCPPSATGNHFNWAKKISKFCSDDWHRWRFGSAFKYFGTHFAESFRMSNLHEWWAQLAHVRCPVAQLLV